MMISRFIFSPLLVGECSEARAGQPQRPGWSNFSPFLIGKFFEAPRQNDTSHSELPQGGPCLIGAAESLQLRLLKDCDYGLPRGTQASDLISKHRFDNVTNLM